MRRRIARRLSEANTPQVWVIDDVSFPKCGRASAGVARQYRGALGKWANCQVAVSVHAATDTASCPLDWQLYLPREWTDEPGPCRRAGVPDGIVHQEKWRLALGLLDNVTGQGLTAPVVVADAGYCVSTPFRHGLQERGLSYVLALTGKEVAHELDIEPRQPGYGGLGPPTLPRYLRWAALVLLVRDDGLAAASAKVGAGGVRLVPGHGGGPGPRAPDGQPDTDLLQDRDELRAVGGLSAPHGFLQGLHDLGIDAHPGGIVMRPGGHGIHADQRQVRLPLPGSLGDQPFQ